MSEERDAAVKSIFKGASIIFAGIFISKFLGLAYRVLVGRYLGPEAYGVISVMMAVYGAAITFATLGMANGVQKFIAEYRAKDDKAKIKGVVLSAMKMVTVSSIATAVILIASSGFLANHIFNEPRLRTPIILVGLAMPFIGYRKVFSALTDAYERMDYQVYVGRIWINVSKIIVAGILVYLGFGYIGAAVGYVVGFASAIIPASYLAYKTFPDIIGKIKPDYEYRKLFHHSWPLLGASIVGIITGDIDTFMLQAIKGAGSTGFYNAAYPFAQLLTFGGGIFHNIFLSNSSKLVAKGKKDELRSIYRSIIKWSAIISFPIFLILLVYPKTALIFFGAEYYTVTTTLQVLLFGFLFGNLIGPMGGIYQSVERTKLSLINSVLVAGSNLGLNFLLIPSYGTLGAAIASTTSLGLGAAFNLVFFNRIVGGLPFRFSLIKVSASAVLGILATYAVSNLLFTVTPSWFFPILFVVFGAVYAINLLMFRTLEEDDKEIIRAIENKTGVETDYLEKILERFS